MAAKKKQYESQAIPTSITATSRISVKIHDTFYTFEFVEERAFPIDLVDEGKIDFIKEKEMLWDEVHSQVDRQVQDVVESLKNGK